MYQAFPLHVTCAQFKRRALTGCNTICVRCRKWQISMILTYERNKTNICGLSLINSFIFFRVFSLPIPVAERSKAWVCSRSPAGIAGSNPAGGMDVCCECCVLSGRGLCDGPIPRSEESYRLWCVIVCDQVNNNPLHLTWLGRQSLD